MQEFLTYHVWPIPFGWLLKMVVWANQQLSISQHRLINYVVGHYKHSNIALQSLLKIQGQLGLSPKRLIQDEPTRWNTTFYILQRLLDLKVAVTAAGAELDVPIELSSLNWILAEKNS